MTTLREAAQQALAYIRYMNQHGWRLTDFEGDMEQVVAGLEAALAQPAPEPVARKPLPDEEIEAIWKNHVLPGFGERQKFYSPIVYARDIEAAHGIKEEA